MNPSPIPLRSMGAAFGVGLVLAGFAVLASHGSGIGLGLRLTARWSFLLFWMAYAGGALAALSGWPAARRGREFGLAFAAAHLVHVGLVVWLYQVAATPPLPPWLLVFFAAGIVWTYLLAALSFGGLVRALGPKYWRLLRFVGMNYILLAFARDFVLAALHAGSARHPAWNMVEYLPFAALCIAAPLLCCAAAMQRRWNMQPALTQAT